MNSQDEIYFAALSKYRANGADLLEQPYMRGVKTSVVEKYSDQAHFIYELLQNADDAGATSVRFDLRYNKLIFVHNGTRRFSISNPETEEADTNNGKLGDINAITSIANSNKTAASIGKFGVGFKAVFQYTQTPSIYDPEFRFRIERFIVPVKIDDDFSGRRPEETLFVFPFDHRDRSREEAYEDISDKLRSLVYPVLFLTNLRMISVECAEKFGFYTKSVDKEMAFGNTVARLITLTQNNDDDENELIKDKLWMFTRANERGFTYSVCLSLNTEGAFLRSNFPAFCFFPTKEVTGLNFILHAPFLLTDSREGIKAGEKHNKDMIKLLAELAADSIVNLKEIGQRNGITLINDHIFDIIPYDESEFNDVNDKNRISFKPFYTSMKEKLSHEELLPSFDGFASASNAYWASVPQIAELFSNDQLAVFTDNKSAKWVFTSFGRQETMRSNKKLSEYIDSITENWYDHEDIIDVITASFIEAQPIEWLDSFYQYIANTPGRKKLINTKPIFLNQHKKAVSAFDSNGQAVLFLPADDVEGYDTVHFALLENDATLDFIKQLGIKEPSLRDEIYNVILPQYKDGGGINTGPHFRKFFKYYMECPQAEVDEYIMLIKDCKFIRYRSADDATVFRGKASDLYIPDENLIEYFAAKPNTRFVELDEYKTIIGTEGHLEPFLKKLGVKTAPRILSRELDHSEACQMPYKWHRSTGYENWTEHYIDGCKEIILVIIDTHDANLSLLLWSHLLGIIKSECLSWQEFSDVINGVHSYFYRSSQRESFDSSDTIFLRTNPWLLNNSGEFVSAKELTLQTLSPKYSASNDEARKLLDFLGIKEETEEDDEDNLTDEQRAKIELADALSDIPPEDLKQFAEQYRALKQASAYHSEVATTDEKDELENTAVNPTVSRVAKEIADRVVSAHKTRDTTNSIDNERTPISDEDDFTKPTVDFSKKIERAKQRSVNEIESIARLEELTQQALAPGRYSFGWFKAILELESLNCSENNANSREISITFSKVERESGTERTLILKHPSRYIPQSMEDLADIPLEMHFANQPMIKVAVEVVNVKSYTLRAKLKTNAQIDGVDLSLITEAKIEARNPVFLLEELQKQFNGLDLDNGFNMQTNLCENIEFVFGPPGTGKTTYLARDIILPLMQKINDLKVLVLTPTNKSADVLVRRLMEVMETDHSYNDWLVRFGATNDNIIEQRGIFRDKTFDIRTFSRNVTVTTIARFPYDYFLPDESTRLHLRALKWDYIIIDEASMIPLVNIIYPLYKKTPEKFIIAGDPFQIEPITTVNIWKNENIYTMVQLNSFTEPSTIPHQYQVKLLTTQYRSIPEIGEVFSRFAYGGVLEHNRPSGSQRMLLDDDYFDIKSLNIIKFPVSKYESIYRPKRLQGKSNYQVYSALFAFEFVKYLSSLSELASGDELCRIGLIAPYRAQSDLVDKLMSSVILPKNIDVQVGTIHGFQGDECDIIITLFNPPPSISASREMFLNKLNIINVSISRARDYLFVIIPDDDTENVGNLTLIKRVEKLCNEQPCWTEHHSHSIEELIFGSESYLEDNSFSTSHQLVNVYRRPEKRYEVRSEDNAVDVQIHE
ncbi:Putative ATPase (DUF699) [Desulfosporosinus orientis DSM 765]|uniref:Putative ATPase (DUF699) n=1 Tax=Desulfosporosinus orientis (strain ATCC 19365 / DSM 765 / NCIMB 8382 / VKM B-1628 / Singapore I) TaxID=768706 RepID=G7WJC4_DESOD|nr:AAA domain-containing protein [Desulfosporosinus orientis]AET69783.1 Putative ATPase (DUF699) [Desulfosporosinus orientis DSM 765]